MAAAGAFACPRCRMAFGSRALLRAHRERLCLEAPAGGGPGGEPGRTGGLRDPSVVWGRGWAPGWDVSAGEDVGVLSNRSSSESTRGAYPVRLLLSSFLPSHPICLFKVTMSQHEDRPKRRPLLLLSGLPRSSLGREGPGRARGAPLGDVLTPRERALLRGPAASRPAERGEPSPPRGDPWEPELLEAHQRHVAEIRARTQQLEQQREQLCQRLALLCNNRLSPEMSWAAEVLSDKAGHQHRGAALHLDTFLLPSGSLAAEARALRLSYLRAGGHDEATLAQLLDLQLEATALEKRAAQKMSKHQPQHRAQGQDRTAIEAAQGLDVALMAVELENQRLEDELLALKVRREMRADVGSLAARHHAEDLAQLQAKVEMLLRHQAEGMGPRLPPAVFPPPVAPPLPPALALAEPPRPTLRTGSPTASSRPLAPSSLPSIAFGALDDPPPPTQEAPALHKRPQR